MGGISTSASGRDRQVSLNLNTRHTVKPTYYSLVLFGASLSEPRIHEEQEAVLYVYMYVCLWGDHFSEKRVKLNSAHAHYTLMI